MKILIISSYAPEVITFRGDMILEMKNKGHEVLVAAPELGDVVEKIQNKIGVKYHKIYMNRTGKNPFQDIKTLYDIIKLIKKTKPDYVFAYTIKPVIYGGIASRITRITNAYAMMSGLGSVSRSSTLKENIIKQIINIQYRTALKGYKKIFFQNTDDRSEFIKLNFIKKENTVMINGSGVNLERFRFKDMPVDNIFIFVGRLLKDKGIREYLEAARIVKKTYKDAVFYVLGPKDSNPSAISEKIIDEYIRDGSIEYLGATNDVRPYLKISKIFVLPSYHEGTSRATLEAMATGRPIITTDAPGCRETVVDGKNGFLVPVKDSATLAQKMIWMIENKEKAEEMGFESFKMCQEKYDVKKVNTIILNTMNL
ncbi:MAG: glycosyltransferase family 4 protein [Crenarchaeota archaeon]|jgi:glycosyltransferase involved in cell wall biosynthesis|nr:glycosyltransferase family 4 protein [Thermoproteota archaeon]